MYRIHGDHPVLCYVDQGLPQGITGDDGTYKLKIGGREVLKRGRKAPGEGQDDKRYEFITHYNIFTTHSGDISFKISADGSVEKL